MKTSAKLTAIQDILMDPDYRKTKEETKTSGMGIAYPGKTKIEQYSPKITKQ